MRFEWKKCLTAFSRLLYLKLYWRLTFESDLISNKIWYHRNYWFVKRFSLICENRMRKRRIFEIQLDARVSIRTSILSMTQFLHYLRITQSAAVDILMMMESRDKKYEESSLIFGFLTLLKNISSRRLFKKVLEIGRLFNWMFKISSNWISRNSSRSILTMPLKLLYHFFSKVFVKSKKI